MLKVRMKGGMARLAVALLVLAALPGPGAGEAGGARTMVYAAASLTDVIEDAARAWREKTGVEVRGVYAASSVLARQIAAGAPADLFISASNAWMDYLDGRGLIERGTRRDVARNRLVVVVPADSPVTEDEGAQLGLGWRPARLAVGETSVVPAGIYAAEALTALGRMEALKDSLVMADSVRVALAWVARGEADAGIVYASDAAAAGTRVRVVWTLPEGSHSPVRYPAAALKGRRAAMAFLDFLGGEEGRRLFAAHGFLPAPASAHSGESRNP